MTQLHLPLKLKNTDGSKLLLASADGRWQDAFYYDIHSSKETVGRYPDGGSECRTFYHPTIGTYNMASSYDGISSDANVIHSPLRHESISYYTISGIKTLGLQKGVNIIRYSDGTSKKVLIK